MCRARPAIARWRIRATRSPSQWAQEQFWQTGARTLGTGRQFTPRNAPSLFNSALGSFYIFWDGRLSERLGPGRPSDAIGSEPFPNGLSGLLAAQAMVPVTNRIEMRGSAGDRDVAGALE